MFFRGNPRGFRFTNGWLRGLCRSWLSSGGTGSPIAQPCPGFWRLSTNPRWKPCAHAFKRMCLPATLFLPPLGLFDRTGRQWLVIDVDGTRQAARLRALPQTGGLPAPSRRFDQVCAPGYQGRKRGEVIRTRTVVLQTHTHQFLGTQIERRASGTTVTTCAGLPR